MNIFKRFAAWLKTVTPKCQECGVNDDEIFGLCEECLTKEFQRVDREIDQREHNKLKRAVKEVLKEIKEEEDQ